MTEALSPSRLLPLDTVLLPLFGRPTALALPFSSTYDPAPGSSCNFDGSVMPGARRSCVRLCVDRLFSGNSSYCGRRSPRTLFISNFTIPPHSQLRPAGAFADTLCATAGLPIRSTIPLPWFLEIENVFAWQRLVRLKMSCSPGPENSGPHVLRFDPNIQL